MDQTLDEMWLAAMQRGAIPSITHEEEVAPNNSKFRTYVVTLVKDIGTPMQKAGRGKDANVKVAFKAALTGFDLAS